MIVGTGGVNLARHDPIYRTNATGFHFAMRSVGFKVIEKPVQWYTNDGDTTLKSYGLYKVGSDGDPVFFKTLTPTKIG